MLPSWAFYLTIAIALLSVTFYILECVVMLQHRKNFRGSFFKIYFTSSIVNCLVYFNSLLTLRLPEQTGKGGLFALAFDKKYIFGLEFMFCMMIHFAFIQYLMNVLFALNRVTAILFPFDYERIWRRCLLAVILIVCFAPFYVTYPLIFSRTEYQYHPELDNYSVHCSTPEFTNIMRQLAYTMMILTVVTTLLNCIVFILFWKRPNYAGSIARSNDLKLFIHNVVVFSTQAFAVIIVVSGDAHLTAIMPFVSDALTLLPPFIILLCSSALQDGLRNLVCKTPVIPIVNMSPTSIAYG